MAGWYPDPVTLGATRYWDGRRWTSDVTYQGRQYRDATPLAVIEEACDRKDAAIVRIYLTDAVHRDVVSEQTANAMRRDLDQLVTRHQQPAAPAAPAPVPVVHTPQPRPVAAPRPAPTPVPAPVHVAPVNAAPATVASAQPQRPVPQPVRIEPGVVAQWWERTREAVLGDLAIHGLAYLGVVLMFAGVFGLFAFSMGDVEPVWRGVAVLSAPTAFLGAAWYLRHRRATAVAAALSLLGGAILPIVAIASLTDGSQLPPDLEGTALPIGQGVLCALIAVVTAAVVWRWPTSMLRFTTAPTLWLGVGVAAGLLRDEIPSGQAVARPAALQMSAIVVAAAATEMAIRWYRGKSALVTATRTVAWPVAAAAFALELLLAGTNGWPVASGVVACGAAVVIVELHAHQVPSHVAALLQVAFLILGGARLAPEVRTEWLALGMMAVLLALTEYVGTRRPTPPAIAVCLVATTGAAALTLGEPAAGISAAGVLMLWLLVRRAAKVEWLPVQMDEFGLAPALASVAVFAEFWRLTGDRTTLLAAAGTALAIGLGRLVLAPLRRERMWWWWSPAVAIAVATASFGQVWADSRWVVAIAVAASAATVAVSGFDPALRTWGTSGLAIWALVNTGAEFELPRATQTVAIASLALALVLIGLAIDRSVPRHLAYVGHLSAIACLCVPNGRGWVAVTVVALGTIGWLATTAVNEIRGAAHLRALWPDADEGSTDLAVLDTLPVLVSLAGVTATTVLALHAAEVVRLTSQWVATSVSAIAIVTAVAARFVPWRRALPVVLRHTAGLLATGALATTSLRVVGVPGWPTISGLAAGIAVVLIGEAPRPRWFVWTAWAQAAPLSVLLADRADLDRRWSDVAFGVWGAVVLLGAIAVERRRSGPAAPDEGLLVANTVPPAVLGSLSFVFGGLLGLADETMIVRGWISMGAAVVFYAVAFLRPLGVISALGHLALTGGVLSLLPWHPAEHPWALVGWAGVLLAVAAGVREPQAPAAARWDLPAFIVGHMVGIVGLALAPRYGSVTATYLAAAGLAAAVAIVVRRWPWAVAAAVLALVGAADAGLGWLALALALHGTAATALGLHRRDMLRKPLLALGSGFVAASWFTFVVWREWPSQSVLISTSMGCAVVALAAAGALAAHRLPKDLYVQWFGLTAAIGATSALFLGQDSIDRRDAGLWVAASYALLAVAVGLTSTVLGPTMRWLATASALAGAGVFAWAIAVDQRTLFWWASGIALVGCTVLIEVHAMRPESPWIMPALSAAMVCQFVGLLAHVQAPADGPGRTVVLLLMLAGETAALAVILSESYLFVASPALATAAWLVYAADTFHDEPNWFTVPVGVALLVIATMIRWIRRSRGGSVTAGDVVLLEFVGMSFVVAASIAQIVAVHLWYSLLTISLGFALATWGTATRVVRRAAFGVGAILLAAVLVVGVPLAHVVPTWRGPALWLALAGFGAAAIVVATLIEQGRQAVRRVAAALSDVTATWEHIGGPDVARLHGSAGDRPSSSHDTVHETHHHTPAG